MVRFRFWVNRQPIADRMMSDDEARHATTVGEGMLRTSDRYLMCVEDPAGVQAPWFRGNDEDFGQQIAQDEYGRKLPGDELTWQKRHGIRHQPAYGPGAN
jgi:hypothetical protein